MRNKLRLMIVTALLLFLAFGVFGPWAQAAPVRASITGEIERIFIDDINDPWSGGRIVVGGQSIILPRNLLIDLPANRLTLKQLFDQAPAACVAGGGTGLAKADPCNTSGAGGFATIAANKTNGGNTIAADVLIEKGRELVAGSVTYINYADGYFRVNGVPGDSNTGVMARLNDPSSRHTVQQGLGCLPGALNCSPDVRFALDADSYTNTFTTGYPVCIPSTVARQFQDVLDLNSNGNTTELLTAQSTSTGTGDLLCPDTNRSINGGQPVDDSRRFAPIQVGDHITAKGNFETINCVRFVSIQSMKVSKALGTKSLATQPDYMVIEQAFIEAPAFQDQKIESLYFGATTRAPADVVIWSVHYDPLANQPHDFLLATTLGCDAAAGVGSCTAKAILPAQGVDIFSISHVVDFRFLPTARLFDPCAHLRADSRFIPLNVCPAGGTFAEQFAIMSPLPRQIHAKTGHKLVNPGLVTLDVRGNQAPNGEYYFQIGIGLGSALLPDFLGINLNLVNTPISFSGIPWNLDRRLSPGGCLPGACEGTAQPLSPFPFEGIDPRTQATTPTGPYIDPNFNNGILSVANNRVLSYVSGTPIGGRFIFNGNSTILAWPPVDPAPLPILPIPPISINGPAITITSFPVFEATKNQPYSYQVLATSPAFCSGGALAYSLDLAPTGMTINASGLIQWTPTTAQSGSNPVTVRVADPGGPFALQNFGIVVAGARTTANDFDKDGIADFAVWRPGNGTWYIRRSSDGGETQIQWGSGAVNDVPVPGDYDGDGITDIAVWRPSNGTWYVIKSTGGSIEIPWGINGDIPVPGDFDGDGKTDLAVWRSGTWFILTSSSNYTAPIEFPWGTAGDIPIGQ